MAALFGLLAGGVVLVHLTFVVFVATGALLALRWPRTAWLHVPSAAWAAYIEFSGGICPLTPLENDLRAKAGLDLHSGDFVAHYLLPVLYPDGLTREAQAVAGALVIGLNLILYTAVYAMRRHAIAH